MANTFKNAAAAATGTSEVSVYTVPSSTTTTVIGLTMANVTAGTIEADIRVYDSSGTAHYYVIKAAEIYTGGALVAVGGDQKLVLETGDIVKVKSDTASSIDIIISVMEQT